MPELTKAQCIKKFFGEGVHGREVTFNELKELAANDKAGYLWVADECFKIVTSAK